MRFEVKIRDGPARIGELLIEDKTVVTPNIFFVNTSRFKAPNFADILITNDNLKTEKTTLSIGNGAFSSVTDKIRGELSVSNYLIYPKDLPKELHLRSVEYNKNKNAACCIIPAKKEVVDDILKENYATLFIVANAIQLFFQQSKFVEFITELRDKIGYQKTIYLPSIGDPSSFALLSYLGVDFFDSTSAIMAARNDTLLFSNGYYNKNDLHEVPCSCSSCSKIKEKPTEMSSSEILQHNYCALFNEIKQVRNAIFFGNLRELVETRVAASPTLAAMLKILDQNHYDFLEERIPITRKNQLISTTKHSLERPEIRRFQERVLTRYEKPSCTKILLIIPCSAKKPYSYSKTHKLFREKLFSLKNPYIVHEVIITSPLGIVPRELELTYPASRYDIAVTGSWDEDEKKMIQTRLQGYLETSDYDKTIVHVPQAIQDFIVDILKNPIITCIDTPTSKESLDELSNVLAKETSQYEQVDPSKRIYENMKALASYQFGKKSAEKLLKNCKIRGKYPYQKIMHNSKQLGMVTRERGMISLTLDGAKKIAASHKYWVEIYDDFTLIGSVFAPGVKDADEKIRIGDEVVVVKKGTVCGVGVAQMNGKEMKESNRSEAVKIRHRC